MHLRDIPSAVEAALIAGRKPRFHPNGFLTLDLDGRRKLHVFPERPLRVRPRGERTHDHVFGFTSRVLVGGLTDMSYRAEPSPDGPYYRYRVPCRAGRCHQAEVEEDIERSEGRYRLVGAGMRVVREGETYSVPPRHLHETIWGEFSATLLELDETPAADRAEVYLTAARLPEFDRRPRNAEELRWATMRISRAIEKMRPGR